MSRYFAMPSLCALAVVWSTSLALASSDAANATLKSDVSKACTTLSKSRFADPIVLVDAFGSASYGIAQIYGRPQSPKGLAQLPGLSTAICVFDKKTKKAELSGEIMTNFVAH
jgi:hypothetical protein